MPKEICTAAKEKAVCQVTGAVRSVTKTSYGYQVILKSCHLQDGRASGFCLLLKGLHEELPPGSTVSVKGRVSEFSPAPNDGGFDEAVWRHSEGIVCQMKEPKIIRYVPCESALINASWTLKKELIEVFPSIVQRPEDAGIFISMTTGDKTWLDSELNALWRKSGIAHLLAISGLHITFIGAFAYSIFEFLNAPKVLCCAAGASAAAFFAFFTGNALSARRALIMYSLFLTAKLCGRTYDRISALSIAFILILADQCHALSSTGFLLSFSAVGGLSLIYPVFAERLDFVKSPVLRFPLDSAAAGASVFLAMLPIESLCFYEVSLTSFFLNLLVIPLSSVLLTSVTLSGTCGLFSLPLGRFLAVSGEWILRVFDGLAAFSQRLPHHSVITGKPSAFKISLYLIFLISGCLMLQEIPSKSSTRAKWRFSLIAGLLYSLALLTLLVPRLFTPVGKTSVLTMLDVGQGDCLVLETTDERVWVIDCGSTSADAVGSRRLVPFLKYHAHGKIDGLFITHGDADHINGAVELLEDEEIEVDRLFLSDIRDRAEAECALLELAEKQNTRVSLLAEGGRIVSGTYSFEVLSPVEGDANEDRNETSLVLYYQEGNTASDFSVLFMGDAGEETEDRLLRAGDLFNLLEDTDQGRAAVLKVGHHGSKYGSQTDFLNAIDPNIALISCGRHNRYGHPSEETLERLRESDIPTFVTSQTGQITISHKDGLVVHCKNSEERGHGI